MKSSVSADLIIIDGVPVDDNREYGDPRFSWVHCYLIIDHSKNVQLSIIGRGVVERTYFLGLFNRLNPLGA